MKKVKLDKIPKVKARFLMNRNLMLKSFDTIAISAFMLFNKQQANAGVKPVTGNYFIAHSVTDIGLAYFSLAVGIFGLYVALNKHNMVRTKMYTYFGFLISWASYFGLFLYKWIHLNGSLLTVIFIALILISILTEMLVNDWSDGG